MGLVQKVHGSVVADTVQSMLSYVSDYEGNIRMVRQHEGLSGLRKKGLYLEDLRRMPLILQGLIIYEKRKRLRRMKRKRCVG